MKDREEPEALQHAPLARAVLYTAVASGLLPPESHSLGRMLTPEGRHTLTLAAGVVDPAGTVVRPAVARFEDVGWPELAELGERHDALFGHTARGPVCAFETEYGSDDLFRQPQELSHIGGYYQAFGLRPRRDGQRLDHIACECEFMALLAGREACLLGTGPGAEAEAREREEQLGTTLAAERSFFRDHLGRFGTAFATRLVKEDRDGFFGAVASLLAALLRCESERLEVPLGPATLNLRPPAIDAVPMGCGSCPGAASGAADPGLEPTS